ncbi:hypothetical protein A3E66_02130 [Candidatus Daviesbacteria bacterium RIFCSPHIGHO2_12_FULL_37_16]|uniref:Uncharacterized protein n=2 Tax=Candidatus Daviesiibacteriota TaxID=1752718 RepID=A0A1F5K713_9BACT|nr:MAG: Transcriptional regulator, XRE family [Candidatus Daviesbacteria bacterium GW2011_GWA1_36_8]OGE33109.1 MAG: hypothetical protein A3C99_03730 [Candidatus Daviesbacteria bacterium RIFCSPHIGHO2_02_FULL_37_9]OGE36707.1 MAG: hypothetical protein A3E66_02130 [Candidatus Daviesbacteria bacterium RIFCSPHIGHO2_12_FULL_37_16]
MFFKRTSFNNRVVQGEWHALWQTSVEHSENINFEVIDLQWKGEYLYIANRSKSEQNPDGGYLWKAQCSVYDSQYVIGTYVAIEDSVMARGTIYLVIHRSGRHMLGHWMGCNFDSEWAHGLMAMAQERERLAELLERHVQEFPSMPYWSGPDRSEARSDNHERTTNE